MRQHNSVMWSSTGTAKAATPDCRSPRIPGSRRKCAGRSPLDIRARCRRRFLGYCFVSVDVNNKLRLTYSHFFPHKTHKKTHHIRVRINKVNSVSRFCAFGPIKHISGKMGRAHFLSLYASSFLIAKSFFETFCSIYLSTFALIFPFGLFCF